MARYRWKENLNENRRQAIHFLSHEVGIAREFLEDVLAEIKQAMLPRRLRAGTFKKAMATAGARKRAIELVREIARIEKEAPRKRGNGSAARARLRARCKELSRLIRRYNFSRPARRSLLVSRLLYGFSRLDAVNRRGREWKTHALHGLAIILYCDGLLRVGEKSVRHALPAYRTVTRRIQRFTQARARDARQRRALKQIAFTTNLRHRLLKKV
jgi:hypothetical protein